MGWCHRAAMVLGHASTAQWWTFLSCTMCQGTSCWWRWTKLVACCLSPILCCLLNSTYVHRTTWLVVVMVVAVVVVVCVCVCVCVCVVLGTSPMGGIGCAGCTWCAVHGLHTGTSCDAWT